MGTQSNPLCASAGGDAGSGPREHDDLECGGRALPWHRADLGSFGAYALSRCARVARMDSCGPLLATHFLLEKQVEGRASLLDHLIGAREQTGRQTRGVHLQAGAAASRCTGFSTIGRLIAADKSPNRIA